MPMYGANLQRRSQRQYHVRHAADSAERRRQRRWARRPAQRALEALVKGYDASRRRAKNASTATNSEEPAIDQTMGKPTPPTLMFKISGSRSQRAISVPSSAPMKPSPIAPKQPPRE